MSTDWLPHHSHWDKNLTYLKLKDDGGIGAILKTFWNLREDQYEQKLVLLPKLVKLAAAFKKSKAVVATGVAALEMANKLIDVLPTVRKKVEQQKRELQAAAAKPVDVQLIMVDWNGGNFGYGTTAHVAFESPGVPRIAMMGKPSPAGVVGFDDVELRDSGTMSLMLTLSTGDTIEGVTEYEVKSAKSVMKFKAIQHHTRKKLRAKSIDEVKTKLGYKVNAGVDFKVLKAGGEVTRDNEYRSQWDDEVEWEVELGMPTFKDFKQI